MAVTIEDLQSFHEFAKEEVERGDEDLSMEELLMQWLDRRDRDEINAVIRQGLNDIDSGRGRPAREVMHELGQKYDLPSE